jgi:hypothetical protein
VGWSEGCRLLTKRASAAVVTVMMITLSESGVVAC